MNEARDDLARGKGEMKRKKVELDEKKERLGAHIRHRATWRRDGDGNSDGDGNVDEERSSKKKSQTFPLGLCL